MLSTLKVFFPRSKIKGIRAKKWIEEIEKYEPAVWLKNEGHDDLYKDVGNVDEYFQKYFVRPLKNFMLQSKDFIGDGEGDIDMDEVSDELEKEETSGNPSVLPEQ